MQRVIAAVCGKDDDRSRIEFILTENGVPTMSEEEFIHWWGRFPLFDVLANEPGLFNR